MNGEMAGVQLVCRTSHLCIPGAMAHAAFERRGQTCPEHSS